MKHPETTTNPKKNRSKTREVKDKSKSLTIIESSLASKDRDVPEYVQLDTKNKTVKLVRVPKFADIPYPTVMEPKLVIEYYSR